MTGFLIVYNRRTGEVHVETYPGPDGPHAAMKARMAAQEQKLDSDVEVVSITAPSLEVVQRTHSRYFRRALADCK